MPLKTLVVIVGPTAVGKTSVAIKLAKKFKSEILSADSRQFYKEISIGTAKPTKEELSEIKHHFINTLNIETNYSVGQYEKDAIQLLESLFQKKDILFLVGGSGLYIDAICKGFDAIPPINPEVRNELNEVLQKKGLKPLLDELQEADPDYYAKVDKANPQRIIRALEVIRSTHKPFSSFHKKEADFRNFTIIKIGLNIDRDVLYNKINTRVDSMIKEGLEQEAGRVLEYKNHNALQTVGYKEFFDFFDKKTSLEETINLIKQHTRNFAKRQLTWFRKDSEIKWFEPTDISLIEAYISKHVNL